MKIGTYKYVCSRGHLTAGLLKVQKIAPSFVFSSFGRLHRLNNIGMMVKNLKFLIYVEIWDNNNN